MFRPASVIEQRRHARVQLHLAVRLRWLGPLGPVLEVGETLDASRQGLLLCRPELCAVNARVWVTFPFDPQGNSQPEIPARVVRVKTTPSGGHLVAIEFELPQRHPPVAAPVERRAAERAPLAVPIQIRQPGAPWPEETMTIDMSDRGILFQSTRVYALGDTVHVTLPVERWSSAEEVPARVVRIESVPSSIENRVAVSFLLPPKS